jgi:uncharacterized membrane protein
VSEIVELGVAVAFTFTTKVMVALAFAARLAMLQT